MSLGTPELLLCLLIALIVLGPEQLPKAARQVGKAIAEVKKFSSTVQDEVHEMANFGDDAQTAKQGTEGPDPSRPPQSDTEGFKLIGGEKPPLLPDSPTAAPPSDDTDPEPPRPT